MDLGLKGRVAIVTGGARGIGRGIAEALLSEGANVVIADLAGADGAPEGNTLAIQADVADRNSVADLIDQAARHFGPVDIMVNNAGIISRKPILDDEPEDFERVLRTNLLGCYNCVRAVGPSMVARGFGRIINISSVHATVAKADMGAYCISKAGIEMFTKQLAVEIGKHGVTANAVAPGPIRTEINIPLYKSTKPEDVALQKAMMRRVPTGRVGEPIEIGRAVAYLASDSASFVNGAVLNVDGGYLAEGTARL